jgi:hypothetical protein
MPDARHTHTRTDRQREGFPRDTGPLTPQAGTMKKNMGWFEEIRDKGPGWLFPRDDKCAFEFRRNLILDIFRPRRGSGLPALLDLMHAAISDEPQAPV